MSDFVDDTRTPDQRASDREHFANRDRISSAVHLAHAAMEHGGLKAADVPAYLRELHGILSDLGKPVTAEPQPQAPAAPEPPKPAVPVKKSVTDEHIVSLIDGSKLQTLTRHLKKHNHTPDSYRAAYGLPKDYPMVAPAYSRKRAQLAKEMGLGTRDKTAAADQPATVN